MSQEDVIKNSKDLITKERLINDLKSIGVKKGMTLIVHSSLSKIGFVSGGAQRVVQALKKVLGSDGTLVMPTHSTDVSDPAEWHNPSVPKFWIEALQETMPAFEPDKMPTFYMGKVVECFMMNDDVIRSNHPKVSFAAWGKDSDEITNNHPLNHGMGIGTPMHKVYQKDGYVLLIGVDYDSNSSMHLGEHLSGQLDEVKTASPILEDDVRVWKTYTELDYDEEKFNEIGEQFERENVVNKGSIGQAESRLMSQPDLVDFTAEYLKSINEH